MAVRPPLFVRTASVLAATPLLVLGGLSLAGELAVGPALLGAAVVCGAALLLARLWVGDLARIIHALHGAGPGGTAPEPPGQPRLASTAHIAREAARLSRNLAQREAGLQDTVLAERALVDRLPDPLIILGGGASVLRANTAATAAFGTSLPAVLRHPGLRAALDRAQAEGREQSAEIQLQVPVLRDVYATVIPLARPVQGGARMVAVLSDRTRERAVERMRADFVANASHELRTPLASLIGFVDTLRGPAADDPAAQTRFLGIMAEQGQRMNRLIDDLLSLSRIELTEHRPPGDTVDVAALVRRMAEVFEPQIGARSITLHMDVADGMPPTLGDEDQLEQVLQNLLDNAVKYGRACGTLRLSALPSTVGKPWPQPGVSIAVTDDGQGIARAHIPRLTERFYRADKHRSRAVGGTGLGLAIVKHIVNRHRGQLGIESTEGVGTTVTVWLPFAPAGGAAAARP